MTSRAASALRRATPAVALLAALGLSGCGIMSPTQTEKDYNAADGVAMKLGTLNVRNLVLVADQEGGPATLAGAVENTGDQSATVTFGAGAASTQIDVPAHQMVTLSTGQQHVLSSIQGGPGDMTPLTVASSGAGQGQLSVPIVPATDYYSTLAPTASPSATSTASPSASPASTSSPTG